MDLLQIIIILALVLAFVGIYILVTILNKKTKVPAGCEFAHLEAACGACLSKTCERKKEEVTV
jgi:hypothetical protein